MQVNKMTFSGLVLLAGILLSSMATAAQEGIYRWKDQNGNLKYSDIPPAGVEAEFIPTDVSRRGSSPEPSEAAQQATGNQAAAPLNGEMEVLPPKDPALCQQAKSNLDALANSPRVRITEPDGSQRFLTEDEKEGQRELARKSIKVHCE